MRTPLVIAATLALTLFALAGTARGSASATVTNGGFEDGTSGWSVADGTTFDTVGSDVLPPAEGARSARLSLSQVNIRIRQTLSAVPAGAYHLSAHVRVNSTMHLALEADPYAACGDACVRIDAPDMANNSWTEIAGDAFVPASSTLTIGIVGRGIPGGVVYIDDVQFDLIALATPTPVPTPTSTEPPSTIPAPEQTAASKPTATPRPSETPAVSVADVISGELRNVGFEDTDADGLPAAWHKYGGTLSSVSASVHGGAAAARLESDTDSTKWIYQTVTVSRGATYAFDAWTRIEHSGDAASLRVSWYTSEDGSGRALSNVDSTDADTSVGDYVFLSTGAVTAPPDARSAHLRVMFAPQSATPSAITIDDAAWHPAAALDSSLTPAATAASDVGTPRTSDGVASVLGTTARPDAPRSPQAPQLTTGAAAARSNGIVLNEVMYDPDTGDDASGEWVELYNRGTTQAALGGWRLSDNGGADTVPDLSLDVGEFVVVAASESFVTTYPQFPGRLVVVGGRIGNGLGNDGDRLTLSDSTGAIVDAISWGADTSVLNPAVPDVPTGHSIERRSPGADSGSARDWIDNAAPSPGRAIDAASVKPQPQNATAPQVLPGPRSPFAWLPWTAFALSAVAALGTTSWRLVPLLSRRLRTHA